MALALSSGSVAPHDFVPTPKKLIGLKLEVSSDIVPRDKSLGTKIFMLVPSEAKTVRDVKSFIANYVLRTPAPFHVFMGEYRIREDEDVQIFSLIDEPCRLLPVPLPRSALSSSTPKLKPRCSEVSSNGKRVTFFDGDTSASPVHNIEVEQTNADVLDQGTASVRQSVVHKPEQLYTPPDRNPGSSSEIRPLGGMVENDSSSPERKKRRRRRHRTRKSKTSSSEGDAENGGSEELDGGTGSATGNGRDLESENSEMDSSLKRSFPNKANRICSNNCEILEILNEETESEDETVNSRNASKSAEFLEPTAVITKPSNASGGSKRQKLSDSAFVSSESFLSPSTSTTSSFSTEGKVRQDTPIVPRGIRNPKLFDSARRIEFTTKMVGHSELGVRGADDGEQLVKDEQYYKSLPPIESASRVYANDLIAFRILELDERYNPSFSAFKEALVVENDGQKLTVKYTKNDIVIRSGKYEFKTDDSPNKIEDNEDTVVIQFSELIEPKYLSASSLANNSWSENRNECLSFESNISF